MSRLQFYGQSLVTIEFRHAVRTENPQVSYIGVYIVNGYTCITQCIFKIQVLSPLTVISLLFAYFRRTEAKAKLAL